MRARRSSSCSRTRRRSSRGCRSTRRSSTSAASGDSPVSRRRSRRGFAAACSRTLACPSRSGSRGRSSSRRSRARLRSPTGCSSFRPRTSSASSTRSRSSGSGASGASPRTSCTGRGIRTVGQVAALEEQVLVWMLGRGAGRHLHALAHNRDPRPVRVGRRRRSIGSQRALGSRPRSHEEIDATLAAIVDRVARRLRTGKRVCRTVVLRLRFADFTRATRSQTMPQATSETRRILDTARELLAAATAADRGSGPDARRALAHEPRGRRPRAARAAVREAARRVARRCAGRDPRPLRVGRGHARPCSSAATPAS